jgi:hypothetical protein
VDGQQGAIDQAAVLAHRNPAARRFVDEML